MPNPTEPASTRSIWERKVIPAAPPPVTHNLREIRGPVTHVADSADRDRWRSADGVAALARDAREEEGEPVPDAGFPWFEEVAIGLFLLAVVAGALVL